MRNSKSGWVVIGLRVLGFVFFGIPCIYNWFWIPQIWKFWTEWN